MPFPTIGGRSFSSMAVSCVIAIAIIAVINVVLPMTGVVIPYWVTNILWIVLVALVAILAIRFIASMGSSGD